MIRSLVHLALHGLVPAAASWWAPRGRRLWVWILMMATMAVDLDHLLAQPLYDPNRCSLTTHPLHAYGMHPVYALLALWPRTRWVGVGLLLHMGLDGIDCLLMP